MTPPFGGRATARTRRWVTLSAAAVVLLGGWALWLDLRTESCLEGASSVEPVSGVQEDPFDPEDLEDGTVVDARTARWEGTEAYTLLLDGGSGACLSGGAVQGEWPADTSWDEMHSTSALLVSGKQPIVEDLRVDGYGDFVRFLEHAEGFVVRRVHLSDIRDDCIENDWLHSGTVQDSLLDGCYNAFSSRTYDGQEDVDDGSENLLTIEDSLIRLQPMERPYKDEGLIPGTAGFFKWDSEGPRLSLRGNIFRADQPANTVGLEIPEDKLDDCSDNVMVWLGPGDYPEDLPECFTLTKDIGVWSDAVEKWKRAHAG